MPHTESAKKRLRQNIIRRQRNRTVMKDLKTQIKKFLSAVKDGKADDARTELNACFKKLDKCAARHYVHPNKADRTKARLNKRLDRIGEKAAH